MVGICANIRMLSRVNTGLGSSLRNFFNKDAMSETLRSSQENVPLAYVDSSSSSIA